MEGDEHVTKNQKLVKEIQKSIPQKEILISEISLWEIAMLSSKNRIQISEPLEDWLEQTLKAPGIRSINLTPKIIADSMNLPDPFHADPSDRLIVATARVLGAILVTEDKLIHKYAKSGNVKTFPLK
jgi:PIN domain nuclease of toxin-antitoxin system